MDKTLFTFAAYNAGPNRIVRLRKEAQERGLDPSKWFGNVELVAAKDIGQETVQYVGNIYKYYVAYKMTLEQIQVRQQPKTISRGIDPRYERQEQLVLRHRPRCEASGRIHVS